MNPYRGFSLLVALLLFSTTLPGCEEFSSIWNGGNGTSSITAYPISVGSEWAYNRALYSDNFRPIDSTYQFEHFSFSSSVTVRATKQILLPRNPGTMTDLILATEFRSIESAPLRPSYHYYTQSGGLLLLHGYIPSSLVFPRPINTSPAYCFANTTFRSLHEIMQFLEGPISTTIVDSITREYPPLSSIKYPLATGDQWTFRPRGRPWRIDKRTGDSRWDPQLQLQYFEVRWVYDLNDDGSWDNNIFIVDRISARGLIRRAVTLLDILVIDEMADEVGYVDYHEEYVVTSISLP